MLLTWSIIFIIIGYISGQSTLTNPAGCTYSFEGICSVEENKQELAALRQQVRLLEETLHTVNITQQLNLQLVEERFVNYIVNLETELTQVKQEVLRQLENVTTIFHPQHTVRDCAELKQSGTNQSGVYSISPNDHLGNFDVYCDMETDGGGWTVFQRRQDGSVDFNQTWDYYKKGFGHLNGEFWLGNDNLHRLTTINNYTLRVDVGDWSGQKRFAVYPEFTIGNATNKYRITFGNYSGNAGDSLSHHRGQKFTTKDQDNDEWSTNCANTYGGGGGWWYKSCHDSNLNGIYYQGGSYSAAQAYNGVRWENFYSGEYSLKQTEMKIRPGIIKP